MRINCRRWAKIVVLAWMLVSPSLRGQLRVGLDALADSGFALLKGKRIGLICNATSVDRNGESSVALFRRNGLDVRVVFAPEHGFAIQSEAGRKVADETLANGIKIVSLYGDVKKPTKETLAEIDALVFDIQDIGTRCYTYVSTMKLAMEAAAESQKEFVVLDRPNPIAPVGADGTALDTAFRSFVGLIRAPFIHALTIGEIATLVQREELPSLKLSVVKMRNYSRRKFADEYAEWKTLFTPPSPNIQSIDAMLLYPATVLLEGTNVSEGRGTPYPFEQIGAPFIDGKKLKDEIGAINGAEIEVVSFTPKSQKGKSQSPKFEGERCGGVRFKITERRKFKPFELAVALLTALNKSHPKSLLWKESFFDKLAGADRLRRLVQQGKSRDEILELVRKESLEAFEARAKEARLYEE
ncbi:MAG: DUF1343 domain-containing protein [Chloroherpetonaceae bacterium]|nr:DUF1343 domain-containing protein [Chloroherpetonaceae bacterium]MDW8436625.1 DUF1343 domain-containing protein [Chloroherpetonaceae bacterium]